MPHPSTPAERTEDEDWSWVKVAHELESVDSRLENLEGLTKESVGHLAALVAIQTRRDAREQTELEIERDRRKASAEAELIRIQAGVAETSARGTWLRSLVSKEMLMPLVSAVVGVLAAAATGVGIGSMTPVPAPGITVNQAPTEPGQPAASTIVTAPPGTVVTVPAPVDAVPPGDPRD